MNNIITEQKETTNHLQDICGYCGKTFRLNQMKQLSIGLDKKIYFNACLFCTKKLEENYISYCKKNIDTIFYF